MTKQQLRRFLLKATTEGFASLDPSQWVKEKDGSQTIIYGSGPLRFHDNFFGGEPFGGRDVLFYKGKPLWIMVYYGHVAKWVKNPNIVYDFLRKALKRMPEDAPYRGPKSFTEKEFRYNNHWTGDIENFFGKETIYRHGKKVYTARYIGGLVDQRSGV